MKLKCGKIHKDLRQTLSLKRYMHSCGVSKSARALAERYGGNPEKAELAGLVHDCAKELSLAEMHDILRRHHLICDEEIMSRRALLHGPAGSVWIADKYGISDEEIANAVYYHTTGRPHMTLLEKIVFLADYIEPSRDFPGVEELRKDAQRDLNAAVLHAYDGTLAHLAEIHAYIYELTVRSRNVLLEEMRQ